MHTNWYKPLGIFLLLFAVTILLFNLFFADFQTAVHANREGGVSYLTLVMKPENTPTPTPTHTPTPSPAPTMTPTPTPTATSLPGDTNVIANGSFEKDWTDMPPAPGNLINQQPTDWTLFWIEPGDPLFDDPGTLAQGVPESIHKNANQLPPHEQPGQPGALILDGVWVYKTFHFGAAFGTELKQTVTGLAPGSAVRVTVPLQVHLHDETDPYGAESSMWINGVGGWANGFSMGDRRWCKHEREVTVPANGMVEVVVRMKSKWPRGKDFFIDDVYMLASNQASPYPNMPMCATNLMLKTYRPAK